MRSKFDMYYGAYKEIQERANELRKAETEAEKVLWKELRGKKFNNLKFRRQHPISQFIVDFYCHKIRLAIEVDGDIHLKSEQREYDENRTAELENFEITILRFKNEEVINDMDSVLRLIEEKVKEIGGKLRERPPTP